MEEGDNGKGVEGMRTGTFIGIAIEAA